MSQDIANKIKKIADLHSDACKKNLDSYVDPESGYSVFTETYHKRRGFCCGSGCRHCPWKNKQKTDK